jgi:benzoyl-CoA reductase/2-hydroxyglutaryl-CoA dehydratase subunit BcrC/BadD/HgdB
MASNEPKLERRKRSRRLEADRIMRPMMAAHWAWSRRASRLGYKVAWVTSGAPVEILRAMSVVPLYPENYGALVAAWKKERPLLQAAEAEGFSSELCSYARAHLGSVLRPDLAPLGGLAAPDVLVASNNICQTVTKWWETLAEILGVPCFLLDTPFRARQEGRDRLRYVRAQLDELVEFLERWLGARYSERKLRSVLRASRRALKLWEATLGACRAHPSPLNSSDRFVYMSPIVNLRGSNAAVAFYSFLLAETRWRAARKVGSVKDERFRLLWDNIAVWPATFKLPALFAKRGCSFPVDTYTSAWSGDFEVDELLDGLARVYSDIFLNLDLDSKLRVMTEMVEEFDLDGAVLHSNRSCKPYSLGQLDIAARLKERNIPVMVLEGDMADPAHVDLERIDRQVDALVDVLRASR